jgi:hypothetical protein
VYPIPAPVDATVTETHRAEQDATPDVTPLLEAQINALRQVSELLRQQLEDSRKDRDDVREDRDRWRSQAERLALPAPATPIPHVPTRAVASRPWWMASDRHQSIGLTRPLMPPDPDRPAPKWNRWLCGVISVQR